MLGQLALFEQRPIHRVVYKYVGALKQRGVAFAVLECAGNGSESKVFDRIGSTRANKALHAVPARLQCGPSRPSNEASHARQSDL